METRAPIDLDAAKSRIRRLLLAARGVAQDPGLVAPLADSTGLSPEGVSLALTSYLETEASERELDELVSKATPAARVHVILSANVFTAPLRALAFAFAVADHVTVRPSRRDPVFTRALVSEVRGLDLALAEAMEVHSIDEGEVHVYGRDETIASVRSTAREGVRIRAHGAGLGVALIDGDTDLDDAARRLADDVVVFDQRGCLSPRVAFVLGDTSRGEVLFTALATHLAELGERVPRGSLAPNEREDGARYVETMSFIGRVSRGDGFAVGLAPSESALVIPPTGRHLHVMVARDAKEARRLLEPIERLVVAIGSDDHAAAKAVVREPSRVRFSPLGAMQRPPLDGPVDLR